MRRSASYYAKVQTRPVRAAPPAVRRSAKEILSTLARKTRYLDPALAARWTDFVGEELVKICRPGRMSGGRTDKTVEIIVSSGAAATRVQMETDAIKHRLNQHLGPNAVTRIAIRQVANKVNPSKVPVTSRKTSRFFDSD